MAAVISFPDTHVTGAVHHWVRCAGTGIYYLGTAEVTPQINHLHHGQDAFNDIAGKTLPFQRTDDGEEAIIASMLNYTSKAAWNAILTSGLAAARQIKPGTASRWSRGGVKFGVTTFELWQVFENALGPGRTAGLELGFYWPQVELEGSNMPKNGTQVQSRLFVGHARPLFLKQASPNAITGNERGWVLYSNDDADFPADVRIPQ